MPDSPEDPLLVSSRREAIISAAVWFVATSYSVIYCWLYGTNRTLDSLTFVLGFPDWIFWGVVIPWLGCTVFSAWFALFYMRDEDLGETADLPTEFSGVPESHHGSPSAP